ncbi:MAG TPA: HNH endonuclease [Blastocatellia bacterium]|nr:HNH endonuclease [Blastocatellia bacterium]HMV83584.1 HNH endonuclease [Blastocatellia bacterium]HMX29074.1 HNH endonuclease [Blastocatellia bacterium]HMY76759.1 HNH endonuclease [Blastocatellia bacterium]HMZ19134.1 HNH endonuclease [Blastocatellia bacterium]
MSKPNLSAELKHLLFERARGCCEYCLSQVNFSPDPFSVEHINPRSRGGTEELENLAFSCLGCNFIKSTAVDAIDPVTNVRVPLFHPRLDRWNEHFAWNEDFTLVQGLTPTGRASIVRLDLNREGLINLREVLVASGKHPPEINW